MFHVWKTIQWLAAGRRSMVGRQCDLRVYVFIVTFFSTTLKLKIHRSKHMRYQLICPFVGLNRQDENKWTMKELYRLCEEYDIKIDVSIIVF